MLRKKLKTMLGKGVVAASAIVMSSTAALAQESSRILEGQGEYLADTMPLWKEVVLIICFIAGCLAILFGGWQFLKKYVLAKSDHEKSFTLGEMVAAMVIGGIIAFPSAGMLFGQDISTGQQDVQEINSDAFSTGE